MDGVGELRSIRYSEDLPEKWLPMGGESVFGCGRESASSGTVNRVDDLGDVAGPGETPTSELLSRSDPLGLRDLLRRLARLGKSR